MALRKRLLTYGYLPENLPPVFSSTSFGASIDPDSSAAYLISAGVKDRTRPATYNATKRGHQRRLFSIPNPVAAHDISLFLEKHWDDISNFFNKSPFSLSVPEIDHTNMRALRITAHNEIAFYQYKRLSSARYIVRTDISRFFPSIYTHALPWSYHGKTASKEDTSYKSAEVYFNRLDLILRQSQDGQTVGIAVGPDASRVIAEIIATAIDREFQRRIDRTPMMIRHVDDIWIGARSRDEADHLLNTYRECLREFELDINELKTSIVDAPNALSPYWPKDFGSQIQAQFERGFVYGKRRRDEQIMTLGHVLEHAYNNGDDGIVKFTIRKIDALDVWSDYWDILEPFLLRCAINFPHAIDYVARVIAVRLRRGEDVDINQWKETLTDLITSHGRFGNDSEVCWALWLLREMKQGIASNACEAVWTRCGPLPIMLLFDCADNNLLSSKPNTDHLLQRLGKAPLSDRLWIVAYEAAYRDWLVRKELLRDAHEYILEMLRKDVTFYAPDAIPKILEGKKEADWRTISGTIETLGGQYDDDEADSEQEIADLDF